MIGIKVLCNRDKDINTGGMVLATIASEPFLATSPDAPFGIATSPQPCVFVVFDDGDNRHRSFHLRRVSNLTINDSKLFKTES